MQTAIGKRIKVTYIDNMQKLARENFIQAITSETNSGKYFNVSDLQSLAYKKKVTLHCST